MLKKKLLILSNKIKFRVNRLLKNDGFIELSSVPLKKFPDGYITDTQQIRYDKAKKILDEIHKPPLLYLRFGKSQGGTNKWLFALLIAPYDGENRLGRQGFRIGNYRIKLRLFGKDYTGW